MLDMLKIFMLLLMSAALMGFVTVSMFFVLSTLDWIIDNVRGA